MKIEYFLILAALPGAERREGAQPQAMGCGLSLYWLLVAFVWRFRSGMHCVSWC